MYSKLSCSSAAYTVKEMTSSSGVGLLDSTRYHTRGSGRETFPITSKNCSPLELVLLQNVQFLQQKHLVVENFQNRNLRCYFDGADCIPIISYPFLLQTWSEQNVEVPKPGQSAKKNSLSELTFAVSFWPLSAEKLKILGMQPRMARATFNFNEGTPLPGSRASLVFRHFRAFHFSSEFLDVALHFFFHQFFACA